jgi:hypothetical protein
VRSGPQAGPRDTCNRIPASVHGWSGNGLDLDVRVHEPGEASRAMLKTVRVVLEVAIDALDQGFIAGQPQAVVLPWSGIR